MSGHRRVIPAESCANDLVLLVMLLAQPGLSAKWCQTSPSHRCLDGHPAPPDQALKAGRLHKTSSHTALPPITRHPRCSPTHAQSAHKPRGSASAGHETWHLATVSQLLSTLYQAWAVGVSGQQKAQTLSGESWQDPQIHVSHVGTRVHTHVTHTHTSYRTEGGVGVQ